MNVQERSKIELEAISNYIKNSLGDDRKEIDTIMKCILGYFDFQLKRYIDTNSFPKISKQMKYVNKKHIAI